MGAADWTCSSGRLRWLQLPSGKRELQQLMGRDGYVSKWMAVPEEVDTAVDTEEQLPEGNTEAQRLAVMIVRHIFNTGICSEYGRPSRIAYKYQYGGALGREQEGGGLGPSSLVAVVREAIRQHTADEACRPQV